jgi:hypothetical protein
MLGFRVVGFGPSALERKVVLIRSAPVPITWLSQQPLKQGVDEGGDGRGLGKEQEDAEQQQ